MKPLKLAALLTAAVLLLSVMPGCGEEDSTQSSTASETVSREGFSGERISDRDIIRVNQIYGSAGCIYLFEKNNIALADGYKDKIRNEAADFIGKLNIEILGTSDLSKLICADHVLSLGEKDRLQKELYVRYNKDADLFDEYAGDDYEGLDEDQKITMQMATTDAVWMQYNAYGIKDEKYDICSMAAKAFNNNVGKYNHNDIYSGKWTVTSELENLFYYMLITDDLDKIEYKTIWDVLGPNYLRDLFESNENNDSFDEFSIANISGMLTDIKARDVLGVEIEPKYEVQNYYNGLDKESCFLYNAKDEDYAYYEYTLFLYLSQPSDLKLGENKFFSENGGKWLKKCYEDNHTKPDVK